MGKRECKKRKKKEANKEMEATPLSPFQGVEAQVLEL